MNIKQFVQDDEGVSPVIGVILMVAITVILAAVIAAFVLGLGDSGQDTPQMSFDFDYDSSSSPPLTITAESGDSINEAQVSFGGAYSGTADSWAGESSGTNDNEDITAGSSATIASGDLTSGETLNVVWESSSGDDSSILASFDVP